MINFIVVWVLVVSSTHTSDKVNYKLTYETKAECLNMQNQVRKQSGIKSWCTWEKQIVVVK